MGVGVNGAIEAYIRKFQKPFLKGVVGAPTAGAIMSYLKLIDMDEHEERDEALDMVLEVALTTSLNISIISRLRFIG